METAPATGGETGADCPRCGAPRVAYRTESGQHTCPRCSTIFVARSPADAPTADRLAPPPLDVEPAQEKSGTLILPPRKDDQSVLVLGSDDEASRSGLIPSEPAAPLTE